MVKFQFFYLQAGKSQNPIPVVQHIPQGSIYFISNFFWGES